MKSNYKTIQIGDEVAIKGQLKFYGVVKDIYKDKYTNVLWAAVSVNFCCVDETVGSIINFIELDKLVTADML